jgi:uncharacterized membrane protein (DUF4010 family)
MWQYVYDLSHYVLVTAIKPKAKEIFRMGTMLVYMLQISTSINVAYLSKICLHIVNIKLSEDSVASTSKFRTFFMLLLPIISNSKVRRWGTFQWQNIYRKFCENK